MTPPRPPAPTVATIDDYCQAYRDLFPDVRGFEAFEQMMLGLLSELPRKSLPAMARHLNLSNSQGLDHFLRQSPWSASELRKRRLALVKQVVGERPMIVLVDETGDRKKGKTTDYVQRQYIGRLGKIDNGIVAVTLTALLDGILIPLTFDVFKPRTRLIDGEQYESKPQIAARLIREVVALGIPIAYISADSEYGESRTSFRSVLEELQLPYVVSLRSNHGVWLPPQSRVRALRWRGCERHLSDGSVERRWIREWVFGARRAHRYWELSTDSEGLPSETTSLVMSWHLPGQTSQQWREISDQYGQRTWIERDFQEKKSTLGWSDFRVTAYRNIERWWELVCCAEFLVSLLALTMNHQSLPHRPPLAGHLEWQSPQRWRSSWRNLQLVLRPWFAMRILQHSLRCMAILSPARMALNRLKAWCQSCWQTVLGSLAPRLVIPHHSI